MEKIAIIAGCTIAGVAVGVFATTNTAKKLATKAVKFAKSKLKSKPQTKKLKATRKSMKSAKFNSTKKVSKTKYHVSNKSPKVKTSKFTKEIVHGNSKKSKKLQHGYEIYEKKTGDVVKTGISGQKLNINGSSPRANAQVNALNKAFGTEKFSARVVETNIKGRAEALKWEIENAMRLWQKGNSMGLHKRPRPWE